MKYVIYILSQYFSKLLIIESQTFFNVDIFMFVFDTVTENVRKIHVYSSHLDDYFNPKILCVALIYFVVILLQ